MKKHPYAPLFPYLAGSLNAAILAPGELIVDNFAGGGGASTGLSARTLLTQLQWPKARFDRARNELLKHGHIWLTGGIYTVLAPVEL